MVTITRASEADDNRSTGEPAPTHDDPASETDSETLLCWICRQPLAETECVRWRGEPIHADCR